MHYLGFIEEFWTKNGGLDMKVVDKYTYIFYFEEGDELELVLRRARISPKTSSMEF